MIAPSTNRWQEAGSRPVRIGNVSGGKTDPGYQMYRQATLGDVDFLVGDYLAEVNIAVNAEAYARGDHDGWEPSALEGLEMSLDVIHDKRIKVIINGGAQNPEGLARRVQAKITAQGLNLRVAYVYGDNVIPSIKEALASGNLPAHLDSENNEVTLAKNALELKEFEKKYVVSANAYLGARAIIKGLEAGADIIICGRVSDASPVIGAASWWHSWTDQSYDELAHGLVAGHMLECSGYATGANLSSFYEYPLKTLIDLPFPLAEISRDGTTIITKHKGTNGFVNEDTCRCQFLYELQGRDYLNSDVSADLQNVSIQQVGKDRVSISGIKGSPPPPTTKLAIFYHGGYAIDFTCNATGYATAAKWKLFESQARHFLKLRGFTEEHFQTLDFQVLGTPAVDPETQFSSTTYCRIFAQADEMQPLVTIYRALQDHGQQHFSGFHLSQLGRSVTPKSYLAYYPALYRQDLLDEGVALLAHDGSDSKRIAAGTPSRHQQPRPRDNYETASPIDIKGFKTRKARLGDLVLARSGDKGANINIGFFVRNSGHYSWLQAFMTRKRMQALMGKDWRSEYFIERCEFPDILAVHFVIYGKLERGVSSCRLLDSLGKGFADFIRDRVVDLPEEFLDDAPPVLQ